MCNIKFYFGFKFVFYFIGYNVHLYASNLPPDTTSDVAVGIIAVDFKVEMSNTKMLKRIQTASMQQLEANINTDTPLFDGFRAITKYDFTASKINAADAKNLCLVQFDQQEPRLAVTQPWYYNRCAEIS